MSDLDDKLAELLDNYEYGPDWQHDGQSTEEEAQTDIKRMVVAIKQAFTDQWRKATFNSDIELPVHEQVAITVTQNLELIKKNYELMTGQEWYNRFEKELDSGLPLPTVMDIWVRKSAKAAAGLK